MDHEYENKETNDTQNDIASVFDDCVQDNSDYMKNHDIAVVRTLAKEYYGVDEIMQMPEHQQGVNSECLYTLLAYKKEDILLHVGTGEFSSEMFTTGNVPEYTGCYHSPLKLFVTNAWARTEDQESSPKEFLAHHTKLYIPKGGQVEKRNIHENKAINYGNSFGIVDYKDVLLALQNEIIHKKFTQEYFKKFCDKIKNLKEQSYDEILKQSNTKNGFHYLDEDDKKFTHLFFDCLLQLSGGNQKNMYKLIKSFDLSLQKFVAIGQKK